MSDVAQAFLARSRATLAEAYLPRLQHCLEALPEDDLWWRPNEPSNSVGNLILHLAGNVRQWIVSGVGEEPDTRKRDEEFESTAGWNRTELAALLEETLREADKTLAGLEGDRLLERRTIQDREVTVLQAVYHVVDHFAMHTGQIIYITKLRTGEDLQFYRTEDGIPRKSW